MLHPSIIESVESPSYGRALAPSRYLTPSLPRHSEPEPDDDDDDDDPGDTESVCHAGRLPPPEPTSARPGTPEKIDVMAQRYDDGLDIWHGDDPVVFPGRVYAHSWAD